MQRKPKDARAVEKEDCFNQHKVQKTNLKELTPGSHTFYQI